MSPKKNEEKPLPKRKKGKPRSKPESSKKKKEDSVEEEKMETRHSSRISPSKRKRAPSATSPPPKEKRGLRGKQQKKREAEKPTKTPKQKKGAPSEEHHQKEPPKKGTNPLRSTTIKKKESVDKESYEESPTTPGEGKTSSNVLTESESIQHRTESQEEEEPSEKKRTIGTGQTNLEEVAAPEEESKTVEKPTLTVISEKNQVTDEKVEKAEKSKEEEKEDSSTKRGIIEKPKEGDLGVPKEDLDDIPLADLDDDELGTGVEEVIEKNSQAKENESEENPSAGVPFASLAEESQGGPSMTMRSGNLQEQSEDSDNSEDKVQDSQFIESDSTKKRVEQPMEIPRSDITTVVPPKPTDPDAIQEESISEKEKESEENPSASVPFASSTKASQGGPSKVVESVNLQQQNEESDKAEEEVEDSASNKLASSKRREKKEYGVWSDIPTGVSSKATDPDAIQEEYLQEDYENENIVDLFGSMYGNPSDIEKSIFKQDRDFLKQMIDDELKFHLTTQMESLLEGIFPFPESQIGTENHSDLRRITGFSSIFTRHYDNRLYVMCCFIDLATQNRITNVRRLKAIHNKYEEYFNDQEFCSSSLLMKDEREDYILALENVIKDAASLFNPSGIKNDVPRNENFWNGMNTSEINSPPIGKTKLEILLSDSTCHKRLLLKDQTTEIKLWDSKEVDKYILESRLSMSPLLVLMLLHTNMTTSIKDDKVKKEAKLDTEEKEEDHDKSDEEQLASQSDASSEESQHMSEEESKGGSEDPELVKDTEGKNKSNDDPLSENEEDQDFEDSQGKGKTDDVTVAPENVAVLRGDSRANKEGDREIPNEDDDESSDETSESSKSTQSTLSVSKAHLIMKQEVDLKRIQKESSVPSEDDLIDTKFNTVRFATPDVNERGVDYDDLYKKKNDGTTLHEAFISETGATTLMNQIPYITPYSVVKVKDDFSNYNGNTDVKSVIRTEESDHQNCAKCVEIVDVFRLYKAMMVSLKIHTNIVFQNGSGKQ